MVKELGPWMLQRQEIENGRWSWAYVAAVERKVKITNQLGRAMGVICSQWDGG